MNKRWTLYVEGFGKLKKAEVRIAPLVCFTGDNNSGKSDLLKLLYGILVSGKELFAFQPDPDPSYEACADWLAGRRNQTGIVDEEAAGLYISWFNRLLARSKETVLGKVFPDPVRADVIEIKDYVRTEPMQILWEESAQRYSAGRRFVKFPLREDYSPDQIFKMNAYICWNLLMDGLAAPMFSPVVRGKRLGEAVYLPAVRAGMVLDRKILAGHMDRLEEAGDPGRGCMIRRDFFRLATFFDTETDLRGLPLKATQFMERELLKGRMETGPDDYYYIPDSADDPDKDRQPVGSASSMIAGLSPLYLLLRSDLDFKTLIIEEPEVHMEPRLAQKMARLLINLANRGIPVWISTDSPVILGYINNMIRLKKNPLGEGLLREFDYQEEDLLLEEEVSIYRFSRTKEGHTQVGNVPNTGYGFAVPEYDDVLDRLLNQIYVFS